MGVKDFNKLLNYCRIAASEIPISEFRGRWIAVDVNYIVMRYYFIARKMLEYREEEKDVEEQITEQTYVLFVNFCKNFTHQGIGLYLCLDKKGDPKVAELKATVKKERWEQRDKIKSFSYKFEADTIRNVFLKIIDPEKVLEGTRVLIAGYYGDKILAEGEALATQLVLNNFAVAVYSGDSDVYAYGATLVIKTHTRNTVHVIALKSILDSLEITLQQLQDISILSGIDFNNRSMPILTAYKNIKNYGRIENLPRNFYVEPTWLLMRKILESVCTPFGKSEE